MSWPRSAKIALAVAALLWLGGLALVPSELAAAKKRQKPTPRTAAAFVLFLGATIGTLWGLPRQNEPPQLPQK